MKGGSKGGWYRGGKAEDCRICRMFLNRKGLFGGRKKIPFGNNMGLWERRKVGAQRKCM